MPRKCLTILVGSLSLFAVVSILTLRLDRDFYLRRKEIDYRYDDGPTSSADGSKQQQRHLHSPFGKRHICPAASVLLSQSSSSTSSVLESIYQKAEVFHNGGGNIKSIENYLNRHMDTTLDRQGMKFYPTGSQTPIGGSTSVTKTIIQRQKELDIHRRGGYDQRQLPGHFQTADEKKLKDFRIDVLEPPNQERWDAGLGPIATDACQSVDVIRTGRKKFEDKFMCSYNSLVQNKTGDTTTSTMATTTESSSCNMMSIGSNRQWGFEEQVVKDTHCSTHTFDCTVKEDPRKPNHSNIHFYPYCIAKENKTVDDGDREYLTYQSMIQATGLTEPPSLFKMDVEGFEFDVMAQMLDEAVQSGSTHMLPLQISVELHYATRMLDLPWKMRLLTAAELSMFMAMMYNRGGYIPVHYEEIGPGCYSCAELLFVRIFCD